MPDGTVRIDTKINISPAEKDLAKLKAKIRSAEEDLMKQTSKKTALEKELEELDQAAIKARENLKALRKEQERLENSPIKDRDAMARNKADIKDQEAYIKQLERETASTQRQIAATSTGIEDTKDQIADMELKAGGIEENLQKASGAGSRFAKIGEEANKAFSSVTKRIAGLAKRVLFFSVILKALNAIKSRIGDILQKNNEFRNAFSSLKGALLTAVQPLIGALVPAVAKLVEWLSKGIWYLNYFIAKLSGKTVQELANEAKALNDVSDAAKDAEKSFASFDEINQIGSKTKTGSSSAASFDVPDLNNSMTLWLDNLALGIQNIIPDFGSMTGDNVASAVLGGLITLSLGATGFIIGGVPGAITATLLGIALNGIISSLKFGNGVSYAESVIGNMLIGVIGAIVGGAIGLKLGGAPGALIGMSVGAALFLLISELLPKEDGKTDTQRLFGALASVMTGVAAGIITFAATGNLTGAIVVGSVVTSLLLIVGDMGLEPERAARIKADIMIPMVVAAIAALIGKAAGLSVAAGAGYVGVSLIVAAVLTLMITGMRIGEVDQARTASDLYANVMEDLGIKDKVVYTPTPTVINGAEAPYSASTTPYGQLTRTGTSGRVKDEYLPWSTGGSANTTVVLEVDKQTLGQVVFDMNKGEQRRIGVSVAED